MVSSEKMVNRSVLHTYRMQKYELASIKNKFACDSLCKFSAFYIPHVTKGTQVNQSPLQD